MVKALEAEGALGAKRLADFAGKLDRPRNIWIMVPAGVVGSTVDQLRPLLDAGDIVIDGGNSYRDDISRSAEQKRDGIHFVDCGTSGGVWGLDCGYCLMIGGEDEPVQRLNPIFGTIAPGKARLSPPRTCGQWEPPSRVYLHAGRPGAGHFVKMVHNGVEYGMMAAIAEGLSIIKGADAGLHQQEIDAETTPLRDPWAYHVVVLFGATGDLARRKLRSRATNGLSCSPWSPTGRCGPEVPAATAVRDHRHVLPPES